MSQADILVIGGGIAGLSAAAELSKHAKVTVLEAEEQIGYHSSGRSATMVHYALGDRLVRALTLASRSFFENPPAAFTDVPLGHRMPVLVHAREDEREALDALEAEIRLFAELERLDAQGVHELCPLLKDDAVRGLADRNGMRLDPHALLQGNLRQLRANDGELHTGERVARIVRAGGVWTVTTQKGNAFSAPVLVNAAGSWADQLAQFAGVSAGRPGTQAADDHHLRRAAWNATRWPAVRKDGRRRALFRGGERPVVRLADGRSAERSDRCAAGGI